MRRILIPLSIAGLLCMASGAIAAPANTCVFTLAMTSGIDVNNLDLKVNYLGTGGNVEGTPTQPECARALGGNVFAAFHDDEANSVLSVAMIRLSHFSAPTPLVACRISYDSIEPTPADFSVNVTNAGRDGGDDNVDPRPTITVTSVECPGELPNATTTTTLPETTTTLPGGDRCGFPVSAGEQPSASDALVVLKVAVGVAECALCICDVNDSNSVAAGDALAILRAAVGIETVLVCPPC